MRQATAKLFKTVKQRRRKERAGRVQADAAVTAATATGAPGPDRRRDAGHPRCTAASDEPVVGHLHRARSCYICKQRYREVRRLLPPALPVLRRAQPQRRDARTDLTGRRALLTGGRAKIGMYIALRLLRDGAHTTITTRFPNDAVRRFTSMPDSADWLHRLRIVGIDLRDPAQVVALADEVAAQGPLDILINNAAPDRAPLARRVRAARRGRGGAAAGGPLPGRRRRSGAAERRAPPGRSATRRRSSRTTLTALALTSGSASLERIADNTAIDAGGLVPDLAPINSWTQRVHEVDPLELLEVQLCNVTAPFMLVSRLRPATGGVARAAHVRRQRLGDGGAVQPRLQGAGPPAHQHGQGGAEHADPHQRAGDARPTASS